MKTLEMIDKLRLIKEIMIGKNVILFGTSKAAEKMLWLLDLLSIHIDYCVDNDSLKWGKCFNGLNIENPATLYEKTLENCIVVVASSFFSDISKQLKGKGLQEGVHYIDGLDLLSFISPRGVIKNNDLVTEPRATMLQAMENIRKLGYLPKTVIDVGVAYGTLPLLEVFPKSRHILIEPLQEFEEPIKKLKESYPIEYVNAAAGKCNGKVTFNVHKNITASSMYEESDGEYADGTKREIDMIRLDQLIEDYELSSGVILKVDVQGAELDVLDGAEKLLELCDAVILEVSFFSVFERRSSVC